MLLHQRDQWLLVQFTNCLLYFSCAGGSDPRTECAVGSYNGNAGSSGVSDCVSCPAGEISGAGSTSCSLCPAGYSCSGGTTTGACAAGQYSVEGDVVCTPCPAGSICPTTTNPPTVCSIATQPQTHLWYVASVQQPQTHLRYVA